MKFTLRFTVIGDEDCTQYSKQNIPLSTTTSPNCTWHLPFKMDGLVMDDTLKIGFCIETDHKTPHYYTLFEHSVNIKKLTFQPPHSASRSLSLNARGFRRQSISFQKYNLPSLEQNCLQVEDVTINYVAEKCNDLIRLHIGSILIPTPSQQICNALARTGITLVLNDYGKATTITTCAENSTRIYKWQFSSDSTMLKTVYNYSLEKYDVDDATTSQPLKLQQHLFQLVFTRYVYFPFYESGLLSKSLSVMVKKIDYEAVISRCNSLKKKEKDPFLYVLERGVRQGILLKIGFDASLMVHYIELHLDNYKDTIEHHFQLN